MFGFPSMYENPRRGYGYQQPQQQQSYDPFGLGGYSRPTHRPQAHTSFRNPYGYQYDPRYYNNENDEDEDEEEQEQEEEYYQPQQRRGQPQQQIRLDDPRLTSQQRAYLLQKQRQQQQQQQQQQEQEELEQLRRQHQHQHQKKHHTKQQSAQHHEHQQRQQQQPQQVPVQKKLREVDQDKEALKIQRQWRGYQVRKYNIISKLRAINKIEEAVDELTATPINQQILNLNPLEPLPTTLDSYYVGKVPRNVMLLEHELAAKQLSLDEISGAAEIVRPRRKALVTKIEAILSKVDAIKKGYATMTPPPNPTPTISTPEDHTTPSSSSFASSSSSTSTTENKKKDTEVHSSSGEQEDKKEESTREDVPLVNGQEQSQPATEDGSSNNQEKINLVDIQDVSEPTPSTVAPIISSTPSSSSTSSSYYNPSSSSKTATYSSSQIPSLKQMCFGLCDSIMKRNLVVPLQVQ